jgi:3-hydroxyacyl-CoA dehydrogenase
MSVFLAAHYRMARVEAKGGFPELFHGWLPMGGATQRLPRIMGADPALRVLVSGAMFPLADGAKLGLTDVVFEGDPRDAAENYCAFLQDVDAQPRPVCDRREGFADPADYQARFAQHDFGSSTVPESAQTQALRLVEAAALLPFESGCAMEEDALDHLAKSEQVQGLTHAHWVEELAANAPPFGISRMGAPDHVSVLGTGAFALQVVILALSNGIRVYWGADDHERLQQNLKQLSANLSQYHAAGGRASVILRRLRYGSVQGAIHESELILDASPGGITPKTPTASLVRLLHGSVHTPLETLGLCFHGTVNAPGLVEILVPHSGEGPRASELFALVRAMRKTPVVLNSGHGTAVVRLMRAWARAADALVDLGADPYEIDRALRDWGWLQLPFVHRDRVGLRRRAYPEGAGTDWSGLVLETGRQGCSAGKGFYDWENGRPRASAQVRQLLVAHRPGAVWPPEEICRHIAGAIANEGMKLIEEDIIARCEDIDVIALNMMGFPRHKGGPMAMVNKLGQFQVTQLLRRVDHPDAHFWQPCATWLAAE